MSARPEATEKRRSAAGAGELDTTVRHLEVLFWVLVLGSLRPALASRVTAALSVSSVKQPVAYRSLQQVDWVTGHYWPPERTSSVRSRVCIVGVGTQRSRDATPWAILTLADWPSKA